MGAKELHMCQKTRKRATYPLRLGIKNLPAHTVAITRIILDAKYVAIAYAMLADMGRFV